MTIGPALERGFYYDSYLGENLKITQEMYHAIEKQAERIASENQPFQRLVLSKDQAIEMFKVSRSLTCWFISRFCYLQENPFKVALIESKVPDGAMTTCYRCGPLVDLCRGPHLPSTGKIKAFLVEKHSAVYWLGNAKNGKEIREPQIVMSSFPFVLFFFQIICNVFMRFPSLM